LHWFRSGKCESHIPCLLRSPKSPSTQCI